MLILETGGPVFTYIMRRVLALIPLLLAVSVIIFALVRITPADPIAALTKGRAISSETRQALTEEFYLDRSLPEQYLIWIGRVLRGDFSSSYQHRQPVLSLLRSRLPTTLQLVLMSSVLAVVLSIGIGVISAVKKHSALDRLLSGFLVICASAPSFLLAMVLMLVFALKLKWFPSFGVGRSFSENLYYLAVPSLALSLNMIALIGRITRSQLISELQSNYRIAETAKGTPFARIVLRHCLKNTLIPVITIAGMQFGGMIVGAVLVENVFALGGVGALLIDGIKAADYPVVQGITLLLVALFMLINLLVDIIYAALDPRIRAARNWTAAFGGGGA
jgi:peptide/nickel transport system permease protein